MIARNQPLIARAETDAGKRLIAAGLATSRVRSDAGTMWWLDLTAAGRQAAGLS